jgi:hypothetical protein
MMVGRDILVDYTMVYRRAIKILAVLACPEGQASFVASRLHSPAF